MFKLVKNSLYWIARISIKCIYGRKAYINCAYKRVAAKHYLKCGNQVESPRKGTLEHGSCLCPKVIEGIGAKIG